MTSNLFFPEPIRPVGPQGPGGTTRPAAPAGRPFSDVLAEKLASSDLKFSAHARQRLEARHIELSDSDLQRLQAAVEKARRKGARESLVLMDRLALVVSVRNNTVITAVDEQNLKENVFTNIDSAVII
ncbi:MAG: flagellar protein [Syntrophomonadaceae bacterium]|nr:flagellar protein [Syntrophomonadaceae bacterium]